jgi:hypothetical protein
MMFPSWHVRTLPLCDTKEFFKEIAFSVANAEDASGEAIHPGKLGLA